LDPIEVDPYPSLVCGTSYRRRVEWEERVGRYEGEEIGEGEERVEER